jgi:mRNA-decapping enzyme 1B
MWIQTDHCTRFLIEKFNCVFLTDNLVEDLSRDFEYETHPLYLLYRNAAQEVNGIWFDNQHYCEAVTSLFGR